MMWDRSHENDHPRTLSGLSVPLYSLPMQPCHVSHSCLHSEAKILTALEPSAWNSTLHFGPSHPSSLFWHIPTCHDPVTMRLKDHQNFHRDRPFRIRIPVLQTMLKNIYPQKKCIESTLYQFAALPSIISQLTAARFLTLNF